MTDVPSRRGSGGTVSRLPRRARSALLSLHVTVSVGWVGLDLSLLVLVATALRAADAAAAAAAGALGTVLLPPLAFGSLVTGLVLSLTTPWGLLRYWWVLAKFVITVALVAGGMGLLLPRLGLLADGLAGMARVQVLVAMSAALVLLVTATALSVVKPWGRTGAGRSGRRPEQQHRSTAHHHPGAGTAGTRPHGPSVRG